VGVTVGVAQAAPVVLDLKKSIRKAASVIASAKREGAKFLAFGETWIPGYPAWSDFGSYGEWGNPSGKKLHARLYNNSLEVGSPEFRELSRAIARNKIHVTIGANERAGRSMYNSLFFFDDGGDLVLHRRKLVPTFGERLVWGHGDAVDLGAYETGFGRVGGLICWEHWMPPARQVLHEAGETIHVAAWPHGKEHHQLASRHYAFEGRCFVLAAALYVTKSMFPKDFELRDELQKQPDVILNGGSAIIGPDGAYVAEPVYGKETILLAQIDTDRAIEETITLDVAGHYSRPDVFDLQVTRKRNIPRKG
jgi:predicted amidohydrolase